MEPAKQPEQWPTRCSTIMEKHNFRRSLSVYAVMAIAALLLAATVWLGFRQVDVPRLPPVSDQMGGRHGAGEDILPVIIRRSICDEERPCS